MDVGNISAQYQQRILPDQQSVPTGSFSGQKITLSDPTSLIANSAEEASFAMSEREEARLEERKMKPKGPSLDRVEQVQKYLELMDRQGNKDPLEAFIKGLSQKKELTARDAAKEATKYFQDSADAYAALHYAGERLGEKFGTDLFLEAMDQLEDAAGRKIEMGIASGVAALEHAALGDAGDLKALYKDTVGDLGSPVDIYERILSDYGVSNFEEALAFLTRSLGNDMAATTVHTDRVQLEGIARDLGTVQLLHGLNAQCKQLDARIRQIHGKSNLTGTDLVKEVLKLRDAHFVGPFDIEAIADKIGIREIEERILFFQEFIASARDFSENLFDDSTTRLNIIDAIQSAIDDAVAIEDELYE